jgi:hypothetical protein
MLEGDPAAEARTSLPTEAAQRAWEEGAALSIDEAAALAVGAAGG